MTLEEAMTHPRLAAWLKRQDPDGWYDYVALCPLRQYLMSVLPKHVSVTVGVDGVLLDRRYVLLPDYWNRVVCRTPRTYGAALTRLRRYMRLKKPKEADHANGADDDNDRIDGTPAGGAGAGAAG